MAEVLLLLTSEEPEPGYLHDHTLLPDISAPSVSCSQPSDLHSGLDASRLHSLTKRVEGEGSLNSYSVDTIPGVCCETPTVA